ncbi:hypothetical protein GON03_07495 [Nocardioides sp. MAH-18]|uniref:Sensor domain-containing protein n=1 Tax=Nocardioides agri TaxID=2682843 RepID=A0A6L6XQK0_9ACTN|nr:MULTISPECIES: hypothetical protein [unclassified Nocardioides]MBA2954161.1 hypothetical protein [Nocardioides sp. CGMCC 1.13656]MVQ49023.1 hypothetical protein [Nocardioides sp. MAH-18]
MHRRWLSRALIALAVPALILPAAATTATAAAPAKVPTIDAVAGIYPHLAGGIANASSSKVIGPGKKCKPGKAIKGASSTSASYSPDYTTADPSALMPTGATPMVTVTAMKFPNAKAAIAYLHGYQASTKDCPGGGGGTGGGGGGSLPDCKTSMKKIKFTLGDERWGYQTKADCPETSTVMNMLFARKGKFIVYANAMSMDATAPSIPSSIDLTKLALSTVG